MAFYNSCPNCGANLDPGEICDCQKTEKAAPEAGTFESCTGKTSTNILLKLGRKSSGRRWKARLFLSPSGRTGSEVQKLVMNYNEFLHTKFDLLDQEVPRISNQEEQEEKVNA